jgi:hypothetical protein
MMNLLLELKNKSYFVEILLQNIYLQNNLFFEFTFVMLCFYRNYVKNNKINQLKIDFIVKSTIIK